MSNETKILDKLQLGNGYTFIPTPVWYSVSVEVPEGTSEAVSRLYSRFHTVQMYLDAVYEQARVGNPAPEMPEEVKEALWPERAEQRLAKTPSKRGSAAASKRESQNS